MSTPMLPSSHASGRSAGAPAVLWALAGAMLTACGGGGDATPSGTAPLASAPQAPAPAPPPLTPTPTPTPAPTPAPAPAPAVALALPSATCGHANFAADLLDRVNRLRAAGTTCGSQAYGAAPPLAYEGRLHQAATAHSQDMVARNYFSHTGSDGSSPGQRVSAAGYAWSTVGENIAAGYGSVAAVVDGWAASPGHCANLMNRNFTQLGIACVRGSGSNPYGSYWTMNLARPR